MNTRLTALVAGIAAFVAVQGAHAQSWYDGTYIELRAGANFFEDADNGSGGSGPFAGDTEFDTGFAASGAIGYKLNNRRLFGTGFWNNVRLEAEIGYNESDIDNGTSGSEISTQQYMFNIYYDYETGTRWRPFVGGGVGAATVETDGVNLQDDDDTVFAYQVRAGVAYQFTPAIAATLGYRFFDTEDPEFRSSSGTKFESETRSHAVEAGLRISF